MRKVFRADSDLHDPRLVDTGDADVFEYAVIDFALARRLDDNVLAAGDQRPECGRLRLLRIVRVYWPRRAERTP